jgi:hypothetical protein
MQADHHAYPPPSPPAGGGTMAVATYNIVYLPASCYPTTFDDSLLEVFLQIVIRSSMTICLEIAKRRRITDYLGMSTFFNGGKHTFF